MNFIRSMLMGMIVLYCHRIPIYMHGEMVLLLPRVQEYQEGGSYCPLYVETLMFYL